MTRGGTAAFVVVAGAKHQTGEIMFIVSLTYKVDVSVVDTYLAEHMAYLEKQYALGHFIASGRKVPRTGGVILARADSAEALDLILQDDPFFKAGVADYAVTEFIATKVGPGLEALKESL